MPLVSSDESPLQSLPLNNDNLFLLCERLGLPEPARVLLRRVRAGDPIRRVRSRPGKPSDHYASHKMGHMLQSKDPTTTAVIYEIEHDEDVLEIWDQPFEIDLEYPTKAGKPTRVIDVPDFLIIRNNSIMVLECLTERELLRRAERMPERYIRGEDGHWRSPSGERWAEQYGFIYQVHSSDEINPTLQRNIQHLEDFYRDSCPPVGADAANAVFSLVEAEPGIKLDELLDRVRDVAGSDDILTLIASEQIFVDLHIDPLPEPARVRCYRDESTARANLIVSEQLQRSASRRVKTVSVEVDAMVMWDGRPWRIVNVGETTISLLRDDKKAVDLPRTVFEAYVQRGQITGVVELVSSGLSAEAKEMLARASREDFKEANRRLRIIKTDLDGREPTEEERAEYNATPDRTRREWKKNFRDAERLYGAGYLGLLPFHWRKGRHGDRLGTRREVMDEFIQSNYETKKQKTAKAAYIAFKMECRKNGIIPPSEKAFRDAIKRRPRREQIQKRQGHRAAYQEKEFCYYLSIIVPQHGDRPFHICHVDHTPLDLELRCARTGRNLGRAWLTLLIDAYSRRILAIWISFDPPSYRSCMMVLRICVKRWNRLPQILVVDGGKEFESVYFEVLLAYYGITKRTRPPAEPRYGSVIERIFETTNEQFIYNLIGNTQVMKNVRQVTKEVNPKNLAVWTLDHLFGGLCEYCYEIYDTKPHSTLGQSPRDAYEQGMARAGIRPHRMIQYDEDFKMMILPTTRKGTALVQPGQGVKINYMYYWSDAFRDRDVERTQVDVRFDPFDLGIAYAFVKSQWVQCISNKYVELQGRSERELMLATQEFRRCQRLDDERVEISEQRLAEFIVRIETQETILQQRLRDEASKGVLALIEGRSREESKPIGSHQIMRPSDIRDSAQSSQPQLLEETEIDDDDIYDDF